MIIRQRYDVVPIDSLEPHPQNVNEGDIGAVADSIDALGFYGACLVQESSGLIIAGKHRWLAARENNEEAIPALFVDVDDDTALRIMLGDNRHARLGHDEPQSLADLLTYLASETPRGLAGTGFDGDDLDELLSELDAAPKLDVSGDDAGDGSNEGGDPVGPRVDTVRFAFGDYSGQVQRAVYDRFVESYESKRVETGEVMLDEVLLLWLGIA